ncbi:hypothetical protein D3C80_1689540 [compost metagenome]
MVVVGHQNDMRCAIRPGNHVHAFHIIDLAFHAGLKDHGTIQQGTRLYFCSPDTANTNTNTFRKIEPSLQQEKVTIGQKRTVRHIERRMTRDRKCAL